MPVIQKIYLLLTIIPGVVIGLTMIALKEDVGMRLIKYGFLLALSGIILSTFFGKQLTDVLFMIDVTGFARAYLAGCVMLLGGIIVQVWRIFRPLKRK